MSHSEQPNDDYDSNNQTETDSHAKDSAPSPTSNHSDSSHAESDAPTKSPSPAQSKGPPPPPPFKDKTPSPSLSPSPSPPPPSSSPPPPSPPPPSSSPPPPSSSPPPPSPSPPPPPSRSPPPPPPSSRSPPPPPRSPPPPSRSPPPPSSSPPPSLPSPSPPPPPSQSPPPLRDGNNNSPPPTTISHKKSPPPPLQAPCPVERPSSPSVRGAPSNDSARKTSTKLIPMASDSGSYYESLNDGGVQTNSKGSSHSSSSGDDAGKYVGYSLAGVFIVALVVLAVAFVFVFKRRKARVDVYGLLYMPPLQLTSGADGHYYAQQPSLANNYGNGNVSSKHVGAPLDSAQPTSAQIVFTYDMVMEITNAFSSQNVIGEGGFGYVYKGWLPDGKAVAVKQLKAGSGQGEREFRAEVEIISRVHHRHLVSLVGYCISEQQRVLIYEYVPNGTLYHHLHGSQMPALDWAKRLKIAIGAAKGLAYLHEDCSQKIIHRDIKSANILLDDAYKAQVADFGLARLADAANTHVSTRVMGTFGYMAPEYATSGKLTDRSDVFSFGVVLLELVTGRKPVDQNQPLGDESLVEWARPLLLRAIETHDFDQLIDPRLENHFVESEMLRMIEAAAACVRHSAPRRPRMVQVLRALDGDEMFDLSNGVKYGQSMVYDSGQYDRDIMLFRRMTNGSFFDSEFGMYSREYNSARETSTGPHQSWLHSTSSTESETRAFNRHSSR